MMAHLRDYYQRIIILSENFLLWVLRGEESVPKVMNPSIDSLYFAHSFPSCPAPTNVIWIECGGGLWRTVVCSSFIISTQSAAPGKNFGMALTWKLWEIKPTPSKCVSTSSLPQKLDVCTYHFRLGHSFPA